MFAHLLCSKFHTATASTAEKVVAQLWESWLRLFSSSPNSTRLRRLVLGLPANVCVVWALCLQQFNWYPVITQRWPILPRALSASLFLPLSAPPLFLSLSGIHSINADVKVVSWENMTGISSMFGKWWLMRFMEDRNVWHLYDTCRLTFVFPFFLDSKVRYRVKNAFSNIYRCAKDNCSNIVAVLKLCVVPESIVSVNGFNELVYLIPSIYRATRSASLPVAVTVSL